MKSMMMEAIVIYVRITMQELETIMVI